MRLLQMSVAGAVIVLAAVVFRAVLINRLPKRTFLVLWWVVLLRLLLPVSFPAIKAPAAEPDTRAPVLGGVGAEVGDLMADVGDFFTGIEGAITDAVSPSAPAAPDAGGNAPGTPDDERSGVRPVSVFMLVWMAGALIAAGVFAVSYLRCRREFAASLPVENELAERWLRSHELRRRVEIRSLAGLATPLTYGVFRPVILMPGDTDWWDRETVKYILYHEYVHIRRFDAVTKLLAALALCLHWFDPLVWVFYVLMNRDIELACDERVVRHFGRNSRAPYARTIIWLEEKRGRLMPLTSYFAKNAIEERLNSIMKTKRTTIFAVIMSVLIIALAITAAAVFSPAEEPDKIDKTEAPTDGPAGDVVDAPTGDKSKEPVDLDAYILNEIVKALPADYSEAERMIKLRIEKNNGEHVYKNGETVAFIVPEMPVKVRISSDGGATWRESVLEGSDKQPEGYPSARYYPNGYLGFNGDSGYAVLASGAAGGHEWIRIYLTSDGGETWYEAGLPDHNEVTTGAGFASDKVGFVSYRYANDHGPDIWRTTDGGETWSRLDLGLPEESDHFYTPLSPVFNGQEGVYPVLLQIHDPVTGEEIESDSVLYFHSHDGGLTWALEDQ